MENIKNLIFDFGGVLYNIEIDRAIKRLKDLGIEVDLGRDHFSEKLYEFEKGEISEEKFIEYLVYLAAKGTNESQIIEAFNSVLRGLNDRAIFYLSRLKKNYNLFLLSNTNIIHYRKFSDEISENPETAWFYDFFSKVYYSYELNLRKPDPDIFNYVINDSHLVPENSLFIDDNIENVNGAESCGLKGFLFKPGQGWEKLINDYKLII